MGRRDPLAANRSAPASRAAPKAEAAKSSPAGSRAGSPRGPPAVDPTKLQIPDCSGQLKKTSKSRLSGRAWKKRWLRVRLDINNNENYTLTYHKKEHDAARMTLALAGCAVRELEGADGWRDFRVFDAHDAFELRATSTEERRAWIDSLRHVITVADARERWIEANASPRPKAPPAASPPAARAAKDSAPPPPTAPPAPPAPPVAPPPAPPPPPDAPPPPAAREEQPKTPRHSSEWNEVLGGGADGASPPTRVREATPPRGSSPGEPPAAPPPAPPPPPGAPPAPPPPPEAPPPAEKEDSKDRAARLAAELDGMMRKLDAPPPPPRFQPDDDQIKRLLGEYGTGRAAAATFVVEVRWGARRGALVVADPRKLRRSKCACWPHEVLAALGIGGDHPAAPWLRVTALQHAEDAFVFGPSLRADRLTPDASYDVVMADERASMLDRLSEGDRDKVEAAVSRHGDLRADRLVKDYAARAQRRLKSIDRQFASAKTANAALRDAHAARVADDERRALAKVTAATFDGRIEHQDALLIEASYLETSLDPEKIPLF
jgi:hypothetical protein